MRLSIVFVAVVALESLLVPRLGTAQNAPPCPKAHAHNDYLHERPLLDALDRGFCSVESDIFLVDGKLLVAHTRSELSPDRTLQSLYLDPLRKRVQSNAGSVHKGAPNFTLLIDIKTDGASTYRKLHELLSEYSELFSRVENGQEHPGAITAIVSGNRPTELIAAQKVRYVGVDGRLSDLQSEAPSHLMPLISDNWSMHFQWRGIGKLPDEDQRKLVSIVEQAHKKNRRVRFWATPDIASVWAALNEANVDLINSDDLQGLSQFLRSKP